MKRALTLFRRKPATAPEATESGAKPPQAKTEKKGPPPVKLAGRPATRRELAFLPAALEVLETPPSPTLRITALALSAFAVIAVAWSIIGEVDIVAVAQGKIVPKGQVKIIQPLEPGIVRAIRVQEGDAVTRGQVLIELDPTESTADRERLATDLMTEKARAARFEAVLAHLETEQVAYAPPWETEKALIETNRRILTSQVREHEARRSALETEALRLQAALRSAEAEVERGQRLLPIAREEAEVYGRLSEQSMASRSEYLDALERLVTIEQDLLVQRAKAAEAETGLTAIAEKKRLAEAEMRREALVDLAESNERIAALTQELTKAEQRSVRRRLVSPIEGSIQRLAVHTIGGVVTQAQELMVVVPKDSELEIEAWVENKDIAFVATGQPAEIKIETLPFTKYGLVDGRVEHVAADALTQAGNAAAETEGRNAPAGGLVYLAKVSLGQTSVQAEGREVMLAPGMSVGVEIKTGTRKLIEYVLSPLLRYRHDAVRER